MSYSAPPPPPPPPPGYGQGPGYGAVPARSSSKAIWSLVLGILGLVCCGFFTGIPALILGRQAQGEIDASGGSLSGRGMATAGFILGIIAIAWGVISVILIFTGVINFNGDFSTSP